MVGVGEAELRSFSHHPTINLQWNYLVKQPARKVGRGKGFAAFPLPSFQFISLLPPFPFLPFPPSLPIFPSIPSLYV